jgi:hypothetical protein
MLGLEPPQTQAAMERRPAAAMNLLTRRGATLLCRQTMLAPEKSHRGRACARGSSILFVAVAVAVAVAAPAAFAQTTPKFDFGKPEEVKVVEWKAMAKGGFLVTSGNSETQSGTLTANASRKEGNNKLTLDMGGAYGRSNNRVPNFTDATMTMYTIGHQSVVSTNNYYGKGRYDRFFTTNNSGYLSAQGASDKIIGKTFFGGGQIGYSRQLFKNEIHLAIAEIGYDFSYERYVQQTGKVLDPVSIHSARVFLGETLKLSPATGATASVEALLNLNKEGAAVDVSNQQLGVGPFKDTRVLGKVGLTTTLHKQVSIGFGFTLKYDQNPAPLALAGVGAATPSMATYFFAEKVDTQTEVTLIFTFL